MLTVVDPVPFTSMLGAGVGRQRAYGRHGERDAFLVAVDQGTEGPTRDGVHRAYLAERLAGARIETCRLMQMRLAPILRPHRRTDAPASGYATRTFIDRDGTGNVPPVVSMRGEARLAIGAASRMVKNAIPLTPLTCWKQSRQERPH
jgi:hypothetical protein